MKAATKRKPRTKAPVRTGPRVEPAPPPAPAAPPPGTSWLASCVDCRGTVYAFPGAGPQEPAHLVDPGEDDREWLRACCGWPAVLRFRSQDEHAREHRCDAPFRRPRYRDTAAERLADARLLLTAAGIPHADGPSGRTVHAAGLVVSCDGGGWRLGRPDAAGYRQFDSLVELAKALTAELEPEEGSDDA